MDWRAVVEFIVATEVQDLFRVYFRVYFRVCLSIYPSAPEAGRLPNASVLRSSELVNKE